MNVRWLVLLLLLILLLAFAGLNWVAFTAVDDLNLLFTNVEAPLGLIMLGVVVVLTLLFIVYIVSIRTGALVDARRYAREAEAARKMADEAEMSRLSELRAQLETEMEALRTTVTEEAAATRTQFETTENVLAAHLAQIDDFLKGASSGDGDEVGQEPLEAADGSA